MLGYNAGGFSYLQRYSVNLMSTASKSSRPIIAAILSLLFCGLGQIYLNRISKGIILAITFLLAIAIIWMSMTDAEFKLLSWDDKLITFYPSQRFINVLGNQIPASDIMKITGSIQLLFTWLFSIADAWREGHN